MIPWEKNPEYPIKFGNCEECEHTGPVKLAWDLRRFICVDYKPCLDRASRNRAIARGESKTLTIGDFDHPITDITYESFSNKAVIVKSPSNKAVNGIQYFTCEKCNTDFQRPATRGRPPKLCPKCRA